MSPTYRRMLVLAAGCVLLLDTSCTGRASSDDDADGDVTNADADNVIAFDVFQDPPDTLSDLIPDEEQPDEETSEDDPAETEPDAAVEVDGAESPDDLGDDIGEHVPGACPADEALTLERPTECSPLSADHALAWAQANIRGNYLGLAEAVPFVEDTALIEAVENLFNVEYCSRGERTDENPDPPDECEPGFPLERSEEFATNVSDFLDEEFLLSDFVESEEDCVVTLRIPPEQLCSDEIQEGETEPPECIWDNVPLRLALWSPQAGDIYAELLVGDERLNPIDARIFVDQFAVIANLPDTLQAIRNMADSDLDLPERVEGLVEANLRQDGEGSYRLDVNFREAVSFAFTIQDLFSMPSQERTMAGGTEAACPAVSVGVNSQSNVFDLLLDLGPVFWDAPHEVFADECEENKEDPGGPCVCQDDELAIVDCEDLGHTVFTVGGINLSSTLAGDEDRFEIAGFGLGEETSTVVHDDVLVIAVDINPDNGRSLDLVLTTGEDEWGLEVTPGLDLHGELHADLSPGFLDGAAQWVRDETAVISLLGTSLPALRVVFPQDIDPVGDDGVEQTDGFLETLSGILALESLFLGETKTVAVGECLVGAPWPEGTTEEEEAEGRHWFDRLEVVDCDDI